MAWDRFVAIAIAGATVVQEAKQSLGAHQSPSAASRL